MRRPRPRRRMPRRLARAAPPSATVPSNSSADAAQTRIMSACVPPRCRACSTSTKTRRARPRSRRPCSLRTAGRRGVRIARRTRELAIACEGEREARAPETARRARSRAPRATCRAAKSPQSAPRASRRAANTAKTRARAYAAQATAPRARDWQPPSATRGGQRRAASAASAAAEPETEQEHRDDHERTRRPWLPSSSDSCRVQTTSAASAVMPDSAVAT